MTLRSKLLLGTFAIGMSASFGLSAFAQGIEVVTVTAAKREQNVQDVPISMTVLSQKTLERYNLSDLADIAAQVPGMIINKGQTTPSLFLRGFGTTASQNPALDQTVSLYVDGVYSGRNREYMVPFFDVARLEVLRGPQGTLLGKNTAAGAISFTTNNPTDVFEAGATVGYLVDRAKGVDADFYVSGPVTDTLKARLAMKIVDKSGWMENAANGKNDPRYASQSGRLTLVFEPSADLTMVTKYEFGHSAQDGRSTTGFPITVARNQIPGFVQNNPGIPGELSDLDRNNAHHFSNNIELGLGDLTLVSQSGFTAFTSRSAAMGRHAPVENVSSDYTDSFKQASQEFRLLSPSDQTFSWIVGVYGDLASYNVGNTFRYLLFPSPAFNGAVNFQYKSDWYTLSAYATGTWNITDDFRLIAGARGTTIERNGKYDRSVVFGTPAGGFPGSGPINIPKQTATESSFDPSVTLQYDITPDIKAYASWAKGSKGGAFQATRSTDFTTNYLKPETSTSYDIGVKSQLWDFLTVNVSAFIMQFKNLQVSSYSQLTPGGPFTLTSNNAGAAESKGVELTVAANLNDWVEGLSFDASGAFIDVRFTDYPGAPCIYSNSPPLGTCVLGFVSPGVQFNGKGLTPDGNPEWTGTASIHYVRDLNDWLKFSGDVSADMKSHAWRDGGNFDPMYGFQPSNTKFNFRAGLGAPDDAWQLAVIGYNVFDVLTTAGKYGFGSVNVFTIEEGRRITLQASVKF